MNNQPDYEDLAFKPAMTWEELCEYAKSKGLEDGNENYPRSLFIPATEDTIKIHFYEDGYISVWYEEELTISTGRRYEQMKNIIDNLYEQVKAQEAMNKKVEEQKKVAKAGQIYKEGSDLYVVTFNDGDDICVIYKDGYASDELLEDFNLGELVAEYPTWQEAVNSKEFKE